MALVRNNPTLNSLPTIMNNGFADADSLTIRECADLVLVASDLTNRKYNAKNFSSTAGNMLAAISNIEHRNPSVSSESREKLLSLFAVTASTEYTGKTITYTTYTFNADDDIEKQCILDFKNACIGNSTPIGTERAPATVLTINLDGTALGIYHPNGRYFVPGTNFNGSDYLGCTVHEYLKNNPLVKERCRAHLTVLTSNNASQAISDLLAELGGALSEKELRIYRAEVKKSIPEDVLSYLHTTSADADPAAICGYFGEKPEGKLLTTPTLINTGSSPMYDQNCKQLVDKNLVIIPPVKNVTGISAVKYTLSADTDSSGIPLWVDFSAVLDGELYHKIYTNIHKICKPDHLIDLAFQVPENILSKYNYAVLNSGAVSIGDDEPETLWKVFPEDPTTIEIPLTLPLDHEIGWTILQRSQRISHLELLDVENNCILGMIFPKKAPDLVSNTHQAYVALDPAGSSSVRLVLTQESNQPQALIYEDMVHPLTPMSANELDDAVELKLCARERSDTHFDSLLQCFYFNGSFNHGTDLMAKNRIWKPKAQTLFDELQNHSGTMTDIMESLSVIANMKDSLTHSSKLSTNVREKITFALKQYIATMLMESILALSKKGFSAQSNNLTFLISYPDNGSDMGYTKIIREVIAGAVAFVNEYLSNEGILSLGQNVKLISEAEASGMWHVNNPPEDAFLGANVSSVTCDCGCSTLDVTIRAKKVYTFSLPFGGQRITNKTIARIYNGRADALMECFPGGDVNLKNQARETLRSIMENVQQDSPSHSSRKLAESLGFTLTLNRLFKNFFVTGSNSSISQRDIQQFTEAKLNVAIPAYAYTFVRALKDGNLKFDEEILLAPVGKGSLAFNNCAAGFPKRFSKRLIQEINFLLQNDPDFPEDSEFRGTIRILKNNDTDKRSVAHGLIHLEKEPNTSFHSDIVPFSDPISHYLNLIYGTGESIQKDELANKLTTLNKDIHRREYFNLREKIFDDVFDCLIENYSFEDFSDAFNRFGYTAIEDGLPVSDWGLLDEAIRNYTKDNFPNLLNQLQAEEKDLIMAVPFVEKEMLCSALLNLALERMPWRE